MIIDSNIIIYSNQPHYEPLLHYLRSLNTDIQASLISKLEVIGFYKLNEVDKADFEAFFDGVSVLPIDYEVITEAIRLRQQRKRSLADASIAATALLYNLPLLINNTVDFEDIPGLKVISMSSVLSQS